MLNTVIRKAEKEYNGKAKYVVVCGSHSYGMQSAHDDDYLVVLDCDNFHSALYKEEGEDVFVYSSHVFTDVLQFKLKRSAGLHTYLTCYMAKEKKKNCLLGDMSKLDYDFDAYLTSALLEAIDRCDKKKYKWLYHSYALLYILQNKSADFTEEQLQMMDRCKALEVTETEIYELKLALEEQLRITQNRQL